MPRRLKLILEYDGRNYVGWQRQPSLPSIQRTLEETFEQVTQRKTNIVASGRTDSGVHALGQVAHCDTETQLSDPILKKALNSLLPKDIIIKELETIDPTFHAQKNALSKIYMYKILNTPVPSPLHREQSWWLPMPLQIEAMNEVAQMILGEHDFKAFQNAGTDIKTTVRTITRSEFQFESPFLIYGVEGSGFLKQMVRNLVGSLVKVGQGQLTPQNFREILESKDRQQCPPPAPARGLFLKKVYY